MDIVKINWDVYNAKRYKNQMSGNYFNWLPDKADTCYIYMFMLTLESYDALDKYLHYTSKASIHNLAFYSVGTKNSWSNLLPMQNQLEWIFKNFKLLNDFYVICGYNQTYVI
jgi:hypothetical protein